MLWALTGRTLDELTEPVTLPVAMDVFPQPGQELDEIAPGERAIQAGQVRRARAKS